MKTKLCVLIDTICLLQVACHNQDVHLRLNHAKDTITHMAPKHLHHRGWDKIKWICNTYLNDGSNPHHRVCFSIYIQQFVAFQQLEKS
jgi:hypothetical protein